MGGGADLARGTDRPALKMGHSPQLLSPAAAETGRDLSSAFLKPLVKKLAEQKGLKRTWVSSFQPTLVLLMALSQFQQLPRHCAPRQGVWSYPGNARIRAGPPNRGSPWGGRSKRTCPSYCMVLWNLLSQASQRLRGPRRCSCWQSAWWHTCVAQDGDVAPDLPRGPGLHSPPLHR